LFSNRIVLTTTPQQKEDGEHNSQYHNNDHDDDDDDGPHGESAAIRIVDAIAAHSGGDGARTRKVLLEFGITVYVRA